MEPLSPSQFDGMCPQEDSAPHSLCTAADRARNTPSWYNLDPRTLKGGVAFPEVSSDRQTSDHVRPDDTFCNSAVTHPYRNRSRLLSPLDSLSSQPVHVHNGISQTARKFSPHSSASDCRPSYRGVEKPRARHRGGPSGSMPPQRQGEVVSFAESGSRGRGLPRGRNLVDASAACAGGEHSPCDSQVLLLVSRTEGSVTLQASEGPKKASSVFNGECVSPSGDPVSHAAMEDVFVTAQSLRSPNLEIAFTEDTTDTTGEAAIDPLVDSFDEGSSDNSDVVEVPVTNRSALAAFAEGKASSKPAEGLPKGWEWTYDVHLNGSNLPKARTSKRTEPSPHLQRRMKLEAIVQGMIPSRCKLSNSSPKSQSAEGRSVLPSATRDPWNASLEIRPRLDTVDTLEDTDVNHTDVQKSRSCPEPAGISTTLGPSGPPADRAKEPEVGAPDSDPSSDCRGGDTLRTSSVPRVCLGSPGREPRAKARSAKRKKRRPATGQSSVFAPQEPEIRLKYLTHKEERKDGRTHSFSPYVRVRRREYSTYVVVNSPEEENVRHEAGQQRVAPSLLSTAIPTSSCLQQGRLLSAAHQQRELYCCLCGRSANVMDLGDLHGPYYPSGFKPSAKASARRQDPKEEEEFSESDSACSTLGAGPSPAGGSGPHPQHDGPGRTSESEGSYTPPAKKPRTDSGPGAWHDPPTSSLDAGEFWIHEDCGVWSADVFLVKGKLYGLEEAVRLAQETVCSTCRERGATLGCFFKGCPSKYHYACALQSDCVLNEDNFSMKCAKHKNKSFKGVTRLENR